jgi:hypothetical protein
LLTSALAGGEWSASRPGRFTPGTHGTGGWVGPRACLDDTDKRKFLTLPGLELQPVASHYIDYAILVPSHNIGAHWKSKVHVMEFQGQCLLHFKCISGAPTGIQVGKITAYIINNFTIANFPPLIYRAFQTSLCQAAAGM